MIVKETSFKEMPESAVNFVKGYIANTWKNVRVFKFKSCKEFLLDFVLAFVIF